MRQVTGRWVVLVLAMLAVPAIALAQATIAGVVRDPSGAVLPGVTVEASSPALIEKVRAAVTDGTGQYRIIDLRPGVYSVAFTLPGFSPVKRDGVELTGAFTATVNVELRVGGVAETITVTGQSPIVDVQGTNQQATLIWQPQLGPRSQSRLPWPLLTRPSSPRSTATPTERSIAKRRRDSSTNVDPTPLTGL